MTRAIKTPAPAAPELAELPKLKIPAGDKLLMVGGVLFVACLFAYHVLGIGKNPAPVNEPRAARN